MLVNVLYGLITKIVYSVLRKSVVPEPTMAPTKLGRFRLQAAPAPFLNIFHFELFKSELLMQVCFGSHLPL